MDCFPRLIDFDKEKIEIEDNNPLDNNLSKSMNKTELDFKKEELYNSAKKRTLKMEEVI